MMGDLDSRLGMGIWDLDLRMELRIGDWDCRLGLKLVYKLKNTFGLEVHLTGCRDAGLARKYSQLNLKFLTNPI